MTNKLLLRVGITGTVLAALCCFTPTLVIALTALGMASLIPRLDPILIPILMFFAAFTFWTFSSDCYVYGSCGTVPCTPIQQGNACCA